MYPPIHAGSYPGPTAAARSRALSQAIHARAVSYGRTHSRRIGQRIKLVLMQEAESAAAPTRLTGLSHLSLLSDEARGLFLPAVTELLLASPGASSDVLNESFGLDFAVGEAQSLLHGAKLVICGVASRDYEAVGQGDALHSELVAAGLAGGAASWVRDAAEAAVKACGAAELRRAQAHAASNYAHDYLADFDWSLYHVLGSSSLAKVHSPLLQLHLEVAKAGGTGALAKEALELTPAELDATLGALAEASAALKGLSEA